MKTNHITLVLIAAGTILVSSAPLSASESDDCIESSFTNSYAYKAHLKNDAIKAESKGGVVILSGEVSETSHRYLAQEAMAGLPGVQRVDNRLEVKVAGMEGSAPWIQSEVHSVLTLHRTLSGSRTQVEISDGVITLHGIATSEAQKELATKYAEDIKGVTRVTNAMAVAKTPAKVDGTVFETVDDASVTALVKVALLLHRSTSSANTQIGTTEGIVTVSGIARNAAEKTRITTLAADIGGVKRVVNNMAIPSAVSESGVKPARVMNLRVVSTRD